MIGRHPRSPLFPYTTLFRSQLMRGIEGGGRALRHIGDARSAQLAARVFAGAYQVGAVEHHAAAGDAAAGAGIRSEEHTSELQSHVNLVCRLLLEKKKPQRIT